MNLVTGTVFDPGHLAGPGKVKSPMLSKSPVVCLRPWAAPSALAGARLWVKWDGASRHPYGGNKARKLAALLPFANAAGAKNLVVWGHWASHQVLATARWGKAFGFSVTAFVRPFPPSPYSDGVKRLVKKEVTHLYPDGGLLARLFWLVFKKTKNDFVIPTGGSDGRTLLGHDADLGEWAQLVASGKAPVPDALVVPLASGGTAVGLALSLAKRGWPTKVLAVPVAGKHWKAWLWVILQWQRAFFVSPRLAWGAWGRTVLLSGYRGPGYGLPSINGQWADETKRRPHFSLDPIYGAKAYGAALHQGALGFYQKILYWHTGHEEARADRKKRPGPIKKNRGR